MCMPYRVRLTRITNRYGDLVIKILTFNIILIYMYNCDVIQLIHTSVDYLIRKCSIESTRVQYDVSVEVSGSAGRHYGWRRTLFTEPCPAVVSGGSIDISE